MNYQGPGIYRHYKGGEYEVLGLALQEDSIDKEGLPSYHSRDKLHGGITFVVYRPLAPGSLLEGRQEELWARELSNFNNVLGDDEEGTRYPRFECLRTAPNWRQRAVAHAQALVSMLVARGVTMGTFGESWLKEACDTVREDLNLPPFAQGYSMLNKHGSIPRLYTQTQISHAVKELEQRMYHDQACTPWALFTILEKE